MKRLLGLFCLLAVTAWADTPSFWSQLTPEERKAAGVDQLTPEQQAALDQLAQRYTHEGVKKEVEVVKAQAQAETAEAVKKARDEAIAEKAAAIKQAKEEAKAEGREHGDEADTPNSGSTIVYLSPGLTAEVASRTSAFAFVQLPVYQRVNGLQLEPRWVLSTGIRWRW